jgi:UDP-N-acetylmuramoylalanine--D-glutamate ligase
MDVAGKKVLIVGAARSGIASARFLAERGAIVALNDRKPIEDWSEEALALNGEGVGLIPGDVPGWLLDQVQLVVVSPGVPTKSIPLRYADRAGAEVIGEIELASRYLRGRIVAITGTNGKTTTTSLIGELLKDAGLPVQVGGNIGRPLIGLVESARDDGWTVVEVSSFQLETIKEFHPTIAVVLNVTPNHMDRYESFMDYAAAKQRIFMNQGPGDVAILNAGDEIAASWASGLRAPVLKFSVKDELDEGLFLRDREIVIRSNSGEQTIMTRDELKLRGLHNVENVLASLAAGLACRRLAPVVAGFAVRPSAWAMRDTIRRFEPVEHRLEFVAAIAGVKFYNDSKATSVDATLKALEAFREDKGKVVLILGGRGKQTPYAPLAPLVREKVRKLILIGEDAATIAKELGQFAEYQHATDMRGAVRRAFQSAESGDVVLLAPACASFDMFDSFEHRGSTFKKEVEDLQIENQKSQI